MYACEKQNLEIIQYLVDHGASLEERDFQGNSIHMHALKTNNSQIINYLREKGGGGGKIFRNSIRNSIRISNCSGNNDGNNTSGNRSNIKSNPSVNVDVHLTTTMGVASFKRNKKVRPKVLDRYPFA